MMLVQLLHTHMTKAQQKHFNRSSTDVGRPNNCKITLATSALI